MRKNKLFGFVALVLAAAMIVGAMLTANAGTLKSSDISAVVDTTTDASQVTSPIIEAVKDVRGSVVGVNNYAITTTYNYGGGYYDFFGGGNRGGSTQKETLSATGSGVVVSQYGHILTNYHVIEDASRVTVSDGEKEYDATVVTASKDLDIAVLLCPGIELPAVPLGDSDQLQVGEWAIVIGNPLGEDFFRSVTVGVVSALEREVQGTTTDKYGRRTATTNAMVQVDAAINSGNSGGGMFNTLGQLMGIPSIKYGSSFFSSTTVDNIGMCIPINVAKPFIKEALELYDGEAVKAQQEQKAAESDEDTTLGGLTGSQPRMGVSVSTLPSTNSAVAQGILPKGAFVSKVEGASPAEKAGIQYGDIIVEVDGVVVTSSDELVAQLQGRKDGDTVALKLYRAEGIDTAQYVSEIGDGAYMDLTVTLKVIQDPAA